MKLNWNVHIGESFTARFVLTNLLKQPYIPASFDVELFGQLRPLRVLPETEQFTVTPVPGKPNEFDVSLTAQQTELTGKRNAVSGVGFHVKLGPTDLILGLATYKRVTGAVVINQSVEFVDQANQTVYITVNTTGSGGGTTPAPVGSVVSLLMTATESISAGRLVMYKGSDLTYYDVTSSVNMFSLVGMSANAANPGEPLTVIVNGLVVIPGWGLVTNGVYLAGRIGAIVINQALGSAFSQVIGRAIDSNTFYFSPQSVFKL